MKRPCWVSPGWSRDLAIAGQHEHSAVWLREREAEPDHGFSAHAAPQRKVERMIAEDDFVAALGEITLKDEAGKAVQHSYCDVWRFNEGKMAELHAFVVEAG